MYDVIIRGGGGGDDVVDGTGGPIMRADVAVGEGTIAAVAASIDPESATAAIDATGCIVSPGFVDPHTHYDGQATWDDVLEAVCRLSDTGTPHGRRRRSSS